MNSPPGKTISGLGCRVGQLDAGQTENAEYQGTEPDQSLYPTATRLVPPSSSSKHSLHGRMEGGCIYRVLKPRLLEESIWSTFDFWSYFFTRSSNIRLTVKSFSLQKRAFSIHEYRSASLFEQNGIPVPKGFVADSPSKALEAASSLDGPVVVKAQVLAGGRGKGHFKNGFKGGVHVANSPKEAEELASKMIGQKLVTKQTGEEGKICNSVFVVKKENIKHEFYFAVLMDRSTDGPAVIASASGGMDIEGVAAKDPSAIIKIPININVGLSTEVATELSKKLGFEAALVPQAADTMVKLYDLFIKTDATQVEINPLVSTTDGRVLCADAKLNFDDNASFRHPELEGLIDYSQIEPLELEAKKSNMSLVKLDGTIGCIVNGAGLAMATMDIIKLEGGSPANFLDLGGGASEQTIFDAFRIITSEPGISAICVNIFGGIVRCDMVAHGIIRAYEKLNLKIPIVVRLQGTNVDLANEMLDKSSVMVYPANDLATAASRVVKLSNEYLKSH
ncbi:hypothetical protein BB560_000606 [Smittium megazygosporum]|uniref:Succinate--CoA ligase [ADP-forming] subunit beta, mitochondrial n=1 Tax=Smittium megazygosporum TaxID=133381 RepID=A0A2T9ZJV6_9FUNG|nr:hypothetical protein BB560_000606 [Smittium megazygosporum]